MAHRRRLTVLLTTIVVLLGLCTWWNHRWSVLTHVRVPQTTTATIFLPGSSGRWLSLRSMVTSLNRPHLATFALTAHVSFAGRVSWQQRHAIRANNPLVPIIFKDNTHPQRQARQLLVVLNQLHRRYGINHINVVGHSSGGTIIYDYLNNRSQAPVTVRRIVTIGADFPERTPLRRVTPSCNWLNLAGTIGALDNDSEVPVATVTQLAHLVAQRGVHYHFRRYAGPVWNTQHSLLHENPALDALIIRALYPPN
ncbi:alpha/beta hydrolase [Levilactobacillus brevis]|uniref:alpha/beta hydrolase n=1 Tax=Levilactobacillus brevis TaxID=1580 RepID=UPI0021A6C76D|nr:alpha/beta hydrolase [Levilactobacillus brevis]